MEETITDSVFDVGAESSSLDAYRVAILDRLQRLRVELPTQLKSERTHEQYPLADRPNSITILGDRGSGKTTLLYAVCRQLVDEGVDLVLPPMQPELFSSSESVISAFLAGLWAMYVDKQGPAERRSDGDRELVRMLTDSARSFAASRTTKEALAHASDSTIDFAEDAVAISRSGARLPQQLRELARRLCADQRLIVVPIDDPDMSPLAVRVILRDLRVLGSIPGVVPIAAFCEDDLIKEWMHEHQMDTPTDLIEASERYERQAEKLFPYQSRFEIQPLSASNRIDFSPIGEGESVRDKLVQLRRAFAAHGVVWPVDEAFGEVDVRFGIPNPLPGNPRTLVQTWNSLDEIHLEPSENSRDSLARVIVNLFNLLTVPLRSSLGQPAGKRLYQLEGAPGSEDEGKAPLAFINFKDVQLYAAPATNVSTVEDAQGIASVKLHKVGRIDAARPTNTSPEGHIEALPGAATAALLSLQELAYSSTLFTVKSDRCRLERKDWRAMQEITLAGLATDDWFLTMSEASTLREVFQVGDDWNGLVASIEEGSSVRELFTRVLWATLESTWSKGDARAEGSYEEAFELATEFYVAHRDREDRVSKRFCNWYEFDLPMQWHSAFFGSELLRNCCRRYREAADRALHRDTSDELVSPRSFLDARWAQILDVITDDDDRKEHCWLAGYFALADALESTKLEELVELSTFWRERIAAQHAGSRVAGKTLNRAAGRHQLAPYSTPEGYELFTRARQLLRKRSAAARRAASSKSARR
jgi:ABC-type phosphonate transport system ATPase subunit